MRGRNKVIGYAFVVGDLFHIGHLKFLEKCKEYCDFLIVGIYNDELTKSYKRESVIPFNERMEIFKALRCVDMVVEVGPEDTLKGLDVTPILTKLVRQGFKIKVLFHGTDWKDVEGRKYIESIGGRLVLIPYYESQSTTKIIKRIKKMKEWERKK